MKKTSTSLLLLILGLCLLHLVGVSRPLAQQPYQGKISPWLLAALDDEGQSDFLVVLAAQADLSPAARLPTRQAKGRWVHQTLWETAQREQAPLRAWLDERSISYRAFYIVNLLHVQAGDRALIQALASRPDVARIEANPSIQNVQAQPAPPLSPPQGGGNTAPLGQRSTSPLGRPSTSPPLGGTEGGALLAVEWNIQKINAAAVWALGYTGQGVVIGGQDTGYDWDHPALINQYRGWNGTLGTHDYNWHDAIHSGGGSCGADSPAPCDDHSHGTHTMGIAVGDDGGSNQIGVAPGARWIGCRNMDRGVGTPATYLECFEFFLAPYPVGGDPSQGNPALAPDVTNNSWGCPASEGCSWDTLQAAVEAQRAAGILTVSSAGNSGPSCGSVRDPAGLYDAAYTVGSTSSSDVIASNSSRGPVTVDGSGRRKPDISAPGVSVRSSVPGSGYGYKSGTSMAAPHVAGAAALLWSAQPALRGQLDQTEQVLNTTALPLYSAQCGDPPDSVPNNVYGWGRLDALAAVQRALALGTGYLEGHVSDDALAGVQSAATQAITDTVTFTASTDASGHYSMTVYADTYTVAAWKYGYAPQVITNVFVADLAAVQVNLVLSRTAPYSLSGCITDSLTGDPLTASLTVIDPLGRPLTETQASSCYSLTLYGSPYTLTVQARLHQPATAFVYLVSDTVHNWSLVPTTADGILWGHVTNQETGSPVEGAAIQASPGLTSTQSDANGYYELQLPPGPYTITVSAPLYAAQTDAYVVVPQGNLIQRDYALPASRLALLPPGGISVTLQLGAQLVRSLTINNAGSQELTFDISSLDIPWLSASPVSGTLGAAATAPVSLTFDAAAVAEDGVYAGLMRLDSNDPQAQPYVSYAFTMTVTQLLPELSLHKTASSDRVEAGTLLTYTITVTNSGGPASGLVISDTLPEHTLLAHGGSPTLNDVLWSDLSAPFSSVLSVSLAVTVTCVPSGTPIVNDAYQVTASEWPTPTRGQALSVTATNEGVVAAFDLGAPVVARNYPARLNNLSQNATSYTWAFGDGHISHATHPTHTYETSGPHTVVLTASNLCNNAVYSQTLTVYEQALTLHPASAAQEAGAGQAITYTLQLTNSGDVSDTYRLSRLSGRWPIILTPSETFTLAAGDSQELAVRISIPFTAAIGAQDVNTILASAGSGPGASAVLSTSVTCVDVSGVGIAHTPLSASLLMTFSGSVLAGSPPLTYTWDFYGSRVGNGPLITHTFPRSATAQTYTVTLTVANACPSTQETQTFITIQPYSFYLPIIMRQLPKEIIAMPHSLRPARRARTILSLAILLVPLLTGSLASGQATQTPPGARSTRASAEASSELSRDLSRVLTAGGPWVVRAYYTDREMVNRLAAWREPWEVHHDQGYLVIDVNPAQYEQLLEAGFRLEIDALLTAQLNQPRARLPGQIQGIPGFACYRTVEETFAAAQNIVAAHPTLAAWVDIGDSWEKTEPGGSPGYDLMVLRLSNSGLSGPKPKLFIMTGLHAREYAPAELNTRFAEYLVDNYDQDPDVTWLLDYHEIHLLLQANPDGRKMAETGLSWRKNTNQNYCDATSNNRGADLNRNFEFQWGCCGGSSGDECSETYRGPSAASEPETQAIQNYVRSQFPDQRAGTLTAAAPITATGVFLDIHSYSELVLWPWGFADIVAPNATQLQTLGRKFAYWNNYWPEQAIGLYPTDGTTDDFAYGDLGLAAFTFEVGTSFFQSCGAFENTILPGNLPSLIYAAKAARTPYQTPAGPDALDVAVSATLKPGGTVSLTATLDDTRYNDANGVESTQNIVAAEYYVDTPPWATSSTPIFFPMSAVDGAFDEKVEAVQATLYTNGLSQGRHILFVRGQDADGNWGAVSSVFVYVGEWKHLYLPLIH